MIATKIGKALPWTLGALGLVVAAVAGGYAVETATLETEKPMAALPLPAAYDVASTQALDIDPKRSEILAHDALALRPVDARAWLNLAITDARAAKRLTPLSTAEFQHSYDVAPYDPQLIADRVAFAYDHWPELPADMREETVSEMMAAWPYPEQTKQLFEATNRARTPHGQMSLALALFRMRVLDNIVRSRPKAAAPPSDFTP